MRHKVQVLLTYLREVVPLQVPFIGWTGDFPLVGSYATKALQYWTNSFATVVMRKTGEQFFLLDGKESSDPLLVIFVEIASFRPLQ